MADIVYKGLFTARKSLPSKLFYDAAGSELFARIMQTPEYYPTRCEREILTEHADEIVGQMPREKFVLVDLGSGDGSKTYLLLKALTAAGRSFVYAPVDISGSALEEQLAGLAQALPDLENHAVTNEFLPAIATIKKKYPGLPVFALFLGSNIGNFEPEPAREFLMSIGRQLQKGDGLLCGFDLQKDPDVIRRAYSDAGGVTAAFNYNLLTRLNRELGAGFDLDCFMHYAIYDPLAGAARSFLVSKQDQQVWFERFGEHLELKAWEVIHTENSFKYTLPGLTAIAESAGFATVLNILDDKEYFADAIWQKV